MMLRAGACGTQTPAYFVRVSFHGRISGVAHDANAAIDRDRTRGPALSSIGVQPAMRCLMILMAGIDRGHEDIYVEERDAHNSSRRRFTSRMLAFAATRFGVKSGKPFLTLDSVLASSDWRARSEITSPSVRPCS